MKKYLHGPMDYAKTMKLRFRAGDLDLPERRGIPVVKGRRKKMRSCALVAKQWSRTHIVGECKIFKEEQGV